MAFFLKNGRPFRRVCSEKHHAHSLVLHCLHFFNWILKDRRDRSVLLRVVIASQDRHFFLKIEERKTKNKNVQRFKNFNLMRVHSINKQGTKCDFTHFLTLDRIGDFVMRTTFRISGAFYQLPFFLDWSLLLESGQRHEWANAISSINNETIQSISDKKMV